LSSLRSRIYIEDKKIFSRKTIRSTRQALLGVGVFLPLARVSISTYDYLSSLRSRIYTEVNRFFHARRSALRRAHFEQEWGAEAELFEKLTLDGGSTVRPVVDDDTVQSRRGSTSIQGGVRGDLDRMVLWPKRQSIR